MREFSASVDVAVMRRKTHDKMLELMPGNTFYPGMRNYVFATTNPSGIRDGWSMFPPALSRGRRGSATKLERISGRWAESWFASSCTPS